MLQKGNYWRMQGKKKGHFNLPGPLPKKENLSWHKCSNDIRKIRPKVIGGHGIFLDGGTFCYDSFSKAAGFARRACQLKLFNLNNLYEAMGAQG